MSCASQSAVVFKQAAEPHSQCHLIFLIGVYLWQSAANLSHFADSRLRGDILQPSESATTRRGERPSNIVLAGCSDFCRRHPALLPAWKLLAGAGSVLPGCGAGIARRASDLRLHTASREDRSRDAAGLCRAVSGCQPRVLCGDGLGIGGDGGVAGKKIKAKPTIDEH